MENSAEIPPSVPGNRHTPLLRAGLGRLPWSVDRKVATAFDLGKPDAVRIPGIGRPCGLRREREVFREEAENQEQAAASPRRPATDFRAFPTGGFAAVDGANAAKRGLRFVVLPAFPAEFCGKGRQTDAWREERP